MFTNHGMFNVQFANVPIKLSQFVYIEQNKYLNAVQIGTDSKANLSNVDFETHLVCNRFDFVIFCSFFCFFYIFLLKIKYLFFLMRKCARSDLCARAIFFMMIAYAWRFFGSNIFGARSKFTALYFGIFFIFCARRL